MHIVLYLMESLGGIIYQHRKAAPLLKGKGMFKQLVYLFVYGAGGIAQNMQKSLMLAMYIAHKVLGALGQAAYGLQLYYLGACGIDRGILP